MMKFFEQRFRRLLLRVSDSLETSIKYMREASRRLQPEIDLTLAQCERLNWENVHPCFILSTGRCGTLLLNRLLLLSPHALAEHRPEPELIRVSRRAYEEIDQHPEIFEETFKTTREGVVLKAALRNQMYIETNNRITFFAPIIRSVFPNAVFIHLVRHPGDVVRSGIRRNWYSGKHDHDIGRIVPVRGKFKDRWVELTSIEKIGWLWNETNRFIEDFKANIPGENMLFVKAEDLFSDPKVTESIYTFLRIDGFKPSAVRKVLKKRMNVQRKGKFPEYDDWDEEDKARLKETAPLADTYGYHL
jgi:hypothetical protein